MLTQQTKDLDRQVETWDTTYMSNTQLVFISDPGHGWLRVPLEDVCASPAIDHISEFSFIDADQRYAYLEEDCDATVYLDSLEFQPPIEYRHVDRFRRPQRRFPL